MSEQVGQKTIEVGESLAVLRYLRDPYIIFEGKRGTSKTNAILSELVVRSVQYPGCRILLCMETRATLSERILTTFEEQVLPRFGLKVPGNQSREGRTVYDMPNGSQFIPIGLREGGVGQSLEASFGYVAEATLCTKQEVTDLLPSLRYLRSPERLQLPDFPQLILDCNPADPENWLNKWAEPAPKGLSAVKTREDYDRLQEYNWTRARHPLRHPKRIITVHQDNPGYWDMEKWDYTPLGKTYVETVLETLTGFQRKRWLDGEWVAAEGSVFPEFGDANIVAPFRVPAEWPVYGAIDPGYDHPCGVVWVAQAPNGRLYVVSEIKQKGLSIPTVAKMIEQVGLRVSQWYLDPRDGFKATQQSPVSYAYQIGLLGIDCAPWLPASREVHDASVAHHRTCIGNGMFKVFATCRETIGEHHAWKYKRKASGEQMTGDDQYSDFSNDLLDGIMGLERTIPPYPEEAPITAPFPRPVRAVGFKPQVKG